MAPRDEFPGHDESRDDEGAPGALQDHYPDDVAWCYGCGRLNPHGLRLRSFVEGDEVVCRFTPRPEHTSFRGFAYGGLIASLIDCHSMATAAAAWMRARGRRIGVDPTERFVTGTLTVKYLRPTPLGVELEVRARATEVGERKVVVESTLRAGNETCASGHVVAVRMPEAFLEAVLRRG